MYKPHRDIRTCRAQAQKFDGKCIKGHCNDCGREIPVCRAFSYVDPDNAAISSNAPILCAECYGKRYGEYPMTADESARQNVGYDLDQLATHIKSDHDATLIHRLAQYVRGVKADG